MLLHSNSSFLYSKEIFFSRSNSTWLCTYYTLRFPHHFAPANTDINFVTVLLSNPLINHLTYYIEYVQTMSMGSNFDEDTLVTSIRKVSNGMKRCSTPKDIPDYCRTLSSPSDLSEVKASQFKNHVLILLW